MIYLIYVYNIGYKNRKKISDESITPPISVIIAAVNSIDNINNNLRAILEQDYPNFEVIVVHQQEDKSLEDELTLLEQEYNNLYHTFIPETAKYISHKKLGLTIGIKAAKNDILLFTESDAHPISNQWIRKIASNFTPDTDFVLGYSNYVNSSDWFNRKIIFDRLIDSIKYLGLAINKIPYKASGYNFAYRKEIFYRNSGFNKHLNLERGEDDLFFNEYAKGEKVKVELSPESVIKIDNPLCKKDWEQEKLSSFNSKKYYNTNSKLISNFGSCAKAFFNTSAVITAIFSIFLSDWKVFLLVIGMILFHFITHLTLILKACLKLNERCYILSFLPFQICQLLVNIRLIIKKNLTNKKDFLRR